MITHELVVNGNRKIESSEILDFSVYKSVNSGQELTIGSVCSAMLKFTIICKSNLTFVEFGDTIKAWEYVNGIKKKTGVFTAEKPKKISASRFEVVAYDNVSLLDKDITDWFSSLTEWPYSLYQIASMTCQRCGLSLKNQGFLNSNYSVKKFEASGITGRDIMHWVAEASGKYCVADENGKIFLGWYSPAAVQIDPSKYFAGSLSFADYSVSKIEKVQIQFSDSDVGTIYPDTQVQKNTYKITGNYLLSENLLPVATEIYNHLKNAEYVPCSFSCPSGIEINAGDIVKITDKSGKQITTYVMSKSFENQTETFECFGSKTRSTTTVLSNQSFKALSGKVLNVKASVDGLRIEAEDFKEGTNSKFEQQSNLISAKVSKIGGNDSFGWSLTDSEWTVGPSGSPVLTVDKNGAYVEGTIESDAGHIGGWLIDATSINVEDTVNDRRLEISSASGLYGGIGGKTWKIALDGSAEFNSATVKGTIEAYFGHIGGWSIDGTSIWKEDYSIVLSSIGGLYSGQNKENWHIGLDGSAVFNKATVKGTIEAESGSIGGFVIANGHLSTNGVSWENTTGGVYIGPEGIATNEKCIMYSSGKFVAKEAEITGSIDSDVGHIGGFTIDSNSIQGGNISLYSSYPTDENIRIKVGSAFSVNKDGKMVCTSGDIGGWDFSTYGTLKRVTSTTRLELTAFGVNYEGQYATWSDIIAAANR